MSGKHTPGPWRFDGPTLKGPSYNIGGVNSHGTVEGKANAHLIAAAPELLEALEAAMEWAEHCKLPTDIRVRMESAIAKAKGTPA